MIVKINHILIKGNSAMKSKSSIPMIVATVVMMAFSVPVTAFSQMDMPMHEHMEGHGAMMGLEHMEKMGDMMDMCDEHAAKMGLSDAQTTKMKPIHHEMQKKQVRFQADVKIAELELMEIMEVKNFDLEKANAAIKKITEIKTAQNLEMVKTMKEVRAILTDEQFNKMKKMPMKKGDHKQTKKLIKKHNAKEKESGTK
jgi:Spy/CpxP family protein refolding chaperone